MTSRCLRCLALRRLPMYTSCPQLRSLRRRMHHGRTRIGTFVVPSPFLLDRTHLLKRCRVWLSSDGDNTSNQQNVSNLVKVCSLLFVGAAKVQTLASFKNLVFLKQHTISRGAFTQPHRVSCFAGLYAEKHCECGDRLLISCCG